MITRPCYHSLRTPAHHLRRSAAHYHDYTRFATPGGIVRVPLNSPKILGVVSSRGNRSHQEDHYAFATLSLPPESLAASIKKHHGIDWDASAVGEPLSREVTFVGIYDGHGGSAVSQYLRQELHGMFESVDKEHIPELYQWARELGGYFKRFRGGVLAPWIDPSVKDTPILDTEARATQAFWETDRHLSEDHIAQQCGATASVAILQSLDAPATAFFASDKLSVTIAHCGDTRVVLCAVDGGKAHPMTTTHHAEAHVEAARLRRMMGSSLVTDSFGESRWMGALANTRSLGDLQFKPFGVTPEPEVKSKLLKGSEWAYMIFFSDGISSILSDDEVVDLARNAPDPKAAAINILSFAEELGSDDNATVIVVPLAGWGKITGPDKTKKLRDYRRTQAVGSERQKRM